MGRPKKVKRAILDTFYYANATPLEVDEDLCTSGSEDSAVNHLKECEGGYIEEVYLYEIKLVGKFRAKFTLEKLD